MQDGSDVPVAFAPVRLSGRAIEICRIYLVANGRNSLQNRNTCLWQGVEDVVTSITRRINTHFTTD